MNTSDEIIVHFSDLTIDIVGGLGMFSSYPCARILIDGTPLVELVRAYETKMLAGDKEVDLAGSYWYIHPQSLIEYLESDGFGDANRIALLGCTCLDEDCWPLVCSMEKQEEYIIWHSFLQPHRREWNYEGFGPFAFNNQQVMTELAGLKSEMRDFNKANATG